MTYERFPRMTRLWLSSALLCFPLLSFAQQPSISIAYPPEGNEMSFAKAMFVLGIATPANGALTVNGSSVTQYHNGAFLEFAPIQPGTFTFHFEFKVGTTTAALDRTLQVGKPFLLTPSEPLSIDPGTAYPSEDMELQEGDWLNLQVKGSPGFKAEFKIPGVTGWLPLTENAAAPGLYQASHLPSRGSSADGLRVRYRLKKSAFHSVKTESSGKVFLPGPIRIVEVSTETVPVRTGPSRSYMLFPFKGTRFVSDGRQGSQLRLRLSAEETGWVGQDMVRYLPEGTAPPQAILGTLKTVAGGRESVLQMALSEAVPATVEEEGEWIKVRLYQTVAHTNWIVYDSSDTFVREVRWRQEASNIVTILVRLDPSVPLWGWRLAYEPGQISLIVRRPPTFESGNPTPLKGLTVVLDPGHSPGKPEGAVGPSGTRESEINLAIAQELKSLLEAEGAAVLLTREGDQELSLVERPRIAWERRGDLFLSIHNNALPDGANPFDKPRGFSVYYYHPHSLAFARTMHQSYLKSSPVPDENLRYGNLLVARESGMPAILTESDYLMFPEREERLLKPEYQKLLARIHREGILEYLKPFLKEEAPPPAVPTAASTARMSEKHLKSGDKATMPKLKPGAHAPDFRLRGVDWKNYSLWSFKNKPILVTVFTCNQCPYAQAYEERLIALQKEYRDKGVQLLAINPNDSRNRPQDSFESMIKRAKKKGFNFPYLRDASQGMAKAYGATHTPQVFVFNKERRLVYSGRADDNWQDPSRVSRHYLREVLSALLAGKEPKESETNPIGCTIKWKP